MNYMNIIKLKDAKFIIKKGMQEGDANIGGIMIHLEAEGFDVTLYKGEIIGIRYSYKTFHQSAIDALNKIAKYVEKGAFLLFLKEDGGLFRLILKDGKFCEENKSNMKSSCLDCPICTYPLENKGDTMCCYRCSYEENILNFK